MVSVQFEFVDPKNSLEGFTGKIDHIIKEIQDQYLEDKLPWIIGFSGGKDSTALLQLVFYALSELPKYKLVKEVHVLSNDTLVENPKVVGFIDAQLDRIREAGKKELFSHKPTLFHVVKTVPKLDDTFWLNLIGKGYPSPNRWFRWCTERMKINPTSAYITETVNVHGRAIILLGTRRDESTNRSKSIKQHEIVGMRLRKHSLPNAYVFAPISEITNKEVWYYLRTAENPWGADNQELVDLYYKAYDNTDCPLVIDTTTPSCGNSRFGCWVCTVVDQDKSMMGMIATGEQWMSPLLKYRDWLAEVRKDQSKRDTRRRTGQDGPGPFLIETRREMLERLLEVENEVGYPLISKQELSAIQIQWNFDGNFHYSVGEIYERIKGEKIVTDNIEISERRREEFDILEMVCREQGVDPNHIRELMELEKEHLSFLRRHNIFEDIRRKIQTFVK